MSDTKTRIAVMDEYGGEVAEVAGHFILPEEEQFVDSTSELHVPG